MNHDSRFVYSLENAAWVSLSDKSVCGGVAEAQFEFAVRRQRRETNEEGRDIVRLRSKFQPEGAYTYDVHKKLFRLFLTPPIPIRLNLLRYISTVRRLYCCSIM